MAALSCCAITTLLLSGVTTDLCQKACENDVRCGAWLLDDKGDCRRCDSGWDPKPTKSCRSVGALMNGPKGCTASNECVICEPQSAPPEQKNVLKKIASGKLADVYVYVSSTCDRYVPAANASFGSSLSVRAIKSASVTGGAIASAAVEARDSINLEGIRSPGVLSVKAKKINVENMVFEGALSGVVIRDTNGLDAQIRGISNDYGGCGGVVNSRGKVAVSNCSCGEGYGQAGHTLIIQQPLELPDLSIDADASCLPNLDVSKEFGMFGREYEIRVFNNGAFARHPHEHMILETMIPITATVLVVLVILLPVLHPAIRKLIPYYTGGKIKDE